MVNAASIHPTMEVVSANGIQLGTVDSVEGHTIKLRRKDPDAHGQHHYIPLEWVESIGVDLRLNKTWEEARHEWQTAPPAAGSFTRLPWRAAAKPL